MHTVLPFLVHQPVVFVLRLQSTTRSSQNDTRLGGQRIRQLKASVCNSLVSGDQRELGEDVIERDLLAGEARGGVVVPDLPTDLDRQTVSVLKFQRADAFAALSHALKIFRGSITQGRYGPHACDHDTLHVALKRPSRRRAFRQR